MKTTIKRYAALFIVFTLLGAGCILLMLDFDTAKATWQSLFGAAACFAAGLYLTHLFVDKHILNE